MNTQPKAIKFAKILEEDHLDIADYDDLAVELRRLHEVTQLMLEALKWIADQTYDPWTNGAEAQRHAIAALAKASGSATQTGETE